MATYRSDAIDHPQFDEGDDHLLEADDELMDIEHDVSQGYGNTWGRGLDRETIKNRLMAREYEVEIGVWFSRAWQLYKSHWQIITLWGVIYVAMLCIPFVGGLLSIFWYAGLLAVGFDLIRTHTNPVLRIRFLDFVPSLFLALPIYLIFAIKFVAVMVGLILLVVPGIYLMVTLQIAVPLYVEFHRDEMSMLDALIISRTLVHKQFWGMTLFFLAILFGGLSGALLLGVGLFVTLPVSVLAICVAMGDIVGLRDTHLYAVGASVIGDDFTSD